MKPFLQYTSGLAAVGLLAFTGCRVGPNYVRPSAPVPPALKSQPPDAQSGVQWKDAGVDVAAIPRDWWTMYSSAELNGLEDRLNKSNQNLSAAFHAYMAARAQIKIDRAALFPTVGASSGASTNLASANRPFVLPNRDNYYNDLTLEGRASWEPDFFGRVRREVESASASAQASAADLDGLRLTLQAQLAVDYFQLRALDQQKQLLDTTVDADRETLRLTELRFHAGLSSDSDVSLAQTQLDQTLAQAQDLGVARAQYENAIATLTGTPASSFTLAVSPQLPALPPAPRLVPSQLLERRPDVAAAERRAAAANAEIGVAQAAFYPTLDIGALAGFESVSPGSWLTGPSTLWTLGATAAETIFDGGRRRGVKQQATETYEEDASRYRQSVLEAFEDAEDHLAALRILQGEAETQRHAVQDAQHSLDLSINLYKRGLANYLQVTTLQTQLLANQRLAVDIGARQATASVQLFKAVGGDWTTAQLPH
jgi:efflux transporter, outer membrane factor (OMF) lipoprotein, NodT family